MTPDITQYQGHSEVVLKTPDTTSFVNRWKRKTENNYWDPKSWERVKYGPASQNSLPPLLPWDPALRLHLSTLEQMTQQARVLRSSQNVSQCQGAFPLHFSPNPKHLKEINAATKCFHSFFLGYLSQQHNKQEKSPMFHHYQLWILFWIYKRRPFPNQQILPLSIFFPWGRIMNAVSYPDSKNSSLGEWF